MTGLHAFHHSSGLLELLHVEGEGFYQKDRKSPSAQALSKLLLVSHCICLHPIG